MQTHNVLDIQCQIAHKRRLITINESARNVLEKRLDELFLEEINLLAEIDSLQVRYEDALAIPRLREQGAAAVAAAEAWVRGEGG